MSKIKLVILAFVLFLCLSGKSYGFTEMYECIGADYDDKQLPNTSPAYCKKGGIVLCSEEHRKYRPDFCGVNSSNEEKPEIQPAPKCLRFFEPDSALGRNFVGVNLCSSEEERQSLLLWVKYLKELAIEK